MAQKSTTEPRDKDRNKRDKHLEIVYKSSHMRVYTNVYGKLIVEDTRTGTTIRIGTTHCGGLEFTTNGKIEPIRATGAWSVT